MINEKHAYRIWDKTQQKYVTSSMGYFLDTNGQVVKLCKDGTNYTPCPYSNAIVEKSTWVKDMNKELIYENDIVEYFVNDVISSNALVTYLQDSYCIVDKSNIQELSAMQNEIRIVGNINENPDFINQDN